MSDNTIYYQKDLFIDYNESQFTFINKLLYWLDKSGKEIEDLQGKWIYNTISSWKKQFTFWSESKIRRIIRSLEEKGVLISHKRHAKQWNHTKWYSIDFNKLSELLKSPDNKQLIYNAKLHKELRPYIAKSKNIISTNSNNISKNLVALNPAKKGEKKWTNRSVQNEQINITSNNYTSNIYSSNDIDKIVEEKEEEIIKNKVLEKKERKTFSKQQKNTELTKEEQEISETMVEQWNKVFEYSLSPIKGYLNKQTIKILPKILKSQFKNNLEEWEEYAIKVNSSSFLMGEKETKKNFKAQFGWLIREEIIESILEGAYGVGDRELDQNKIEESVKKKESEVQYKTQRKIANLLEEKLEDECEQKEFRKYFSSEEYEEDGDQYKLKEYGESLLKYTNIFFSPNSILYGYDTEVTRKLLFENYIMMKHMGISKLEIDKKIKESFKKESNKKQRFKFLDKILNQIEKIGIISRNEGSISFLKLLN